MFYQIGPKARILSIKVNFSLKIFQQKLDLIFIQGRMKIFSEKFSFIFADKWQPLFEYLLYLKESIKITTNIVLSKVKGIMP